MGAVPTPTALLSAEAPTAGDTMVPTAYRVVRREQETDDTATIALVAQGEPLGDPEPGQFMMVWAPGIGEIPVSVAGCHDGELLFTIRAVGATSAALSEAGEGAVLGLRGPFGRAWTLPEPDRPAVVVAGGLGLAPLRMLVERTLERGRDAPLEVVVGARRPEEVLYRDLLDEWGLQCRVSLTVDWPGADWEGDVGLVTAELARMELGPGTGAAVCGPEAMMSVVATDLVGAGVRAEEIEVSLERSMACAVAHCGRCQLGPVMVCRDGPVMPWSTAAALLEVPRW
jgi:NAD(P)H-flavin reductase